jgi:hypothetical protein
MANDLIREPDDIFVDATFEMEMRLAELMARARLVPRELQGSPADCLQVIRLARRWQMDPFAVAQECSVIRGKLMVDGKLTAAVVNTRGNLKVPLSFEYSGEGLQRKVVVSGQRQTDEDLVTIDVVLENVQTDNIWWKKQPDQQLAYHGARVWARRYAPELVLGVYSREEFNAEQGGPVKRVQHRAAPLPPQELNEKIDADTGEIQIEKIAEKYGNPDDPYAPAGLPPDRAGEIVRKLRDARDAEERGQAGEVARVRDAYRSTYESLDQAGKDRVQAALKYLAS